MVRKRASRSRQSLVQAATTIERLTTKYDLELPADYYFAVGHAFFEKGDRLEARRNFNRGLRLDPANADAWWHVIDSYIATHHYKRALTLATQAIAKVPDAPDLHMLRGIALSELGRYAAALREFDHPSVRTDTSRETQMLRYRNRAATHARKEDWQSALADMRRAYQLAPSADLLMGIAEAYQSLGNPGKTLRYAKLAVRKNPRLADAWNLIGVLQVSRKDFKASAKSLKRAAKLQPNDVMILSNLAHTLYHVGSTADVIEVCKRIAEVEDKNEDAYYFWASALLREGDVIQALKVVDTGLRKVKRRADLRRLRLTIEAQVDRAR